MKIFLFLLVSSITFAGPKNLSEAFAEAKTYMNESSSRAAFNAFMIERNGIQYMDAEAACSKSYTMKKLMEFSGMLETSGVPQTAPDFYNTLVRISTKMDEALYDHPVTKEEAHAWVTLLLRAFGDSQSEIDSVLEKLPWRYVTFDAPARQLGEPDNQTPVYSVKSLDYLELVIEGKIGEKSRRNKRNLEYERTIRGFSSNAVPAYKLDWRF